MPGSLTAPRPFSPGPALARGRSRALVARALRLGAALGLLVAAGAGAGIAAAAETCPDTPDERGHVAAVSPAGDLVLADGTVLRLAGLAGGGAGTDVAWRALLARKVAGREVAFAAASARDRYGRRAAIAREAAVAGSPDGSAPTLQQALLAAGVALARPEQGFAGCLAQWLEAEATARRGRLGLWRRLPLDARRVGPIRARQGRFTIVAGRVLDVGKSSRVDYLNFGRVWRQDMTGRLERPARVALESRGMAPADFAGRNVRLRGTVFESGGPTIAIADAGQIEWDDGTPGDAGRAGDEARGRARPTGDE